MLTTMIYNHQLITTQKIDEIHKIHGRLQPRQAIWLDLRCRLEIVVARKNHLVEGETFSKSTVDEVVLWTNTRSINTIKVPVRQIHQIAPQTIVVQKKRRLRRCATNAQTRR